MTNINFSECDGIPVENVSTISLKVNKSKQYFNENHKFSNVILSKCKSLSKLDKFSGLTLRVLDISYCKNITSDAFQDMIKSSPYLKDVNIGYCNQLLQYDITFLFDNCKYIEKLNVSHMFARPNEKIEVQM